MCRSFYCDITDKYAFVNDKKRRQSFSNFNRPYSLLLRKLVRAVNSLDANIATRVKVGFLPNLNVLAYRTCNYGNEVIDCNYSIATDFLHEQT